MGYILNVLIVEDDPNVRDALTRFVEGLGHRVWTRVDGVVAWALLHNNNNHFDAVLTDYEMPGGDGITLIDRMKRDKNTRSIPVALVTGGLPKGVSCPEANAFIVKGPGALERIEQFLKKQERN